MSAQHAPARTGPSPYDGLADHYDRARPSYPPEIIAHLRAEAGDIVADVAAGTGIFTRQLALALRQAQVVGIEPSEDMHRAAQRSAAHITNLSFMRGRAEALALADKSVRWLTVATAIHWFDRPVFYAEAARCLRGDGALLVLQNIRRWWEDAFLADYESLHEQGVASYRRGRYPARDGGYAELDVEAELRARPDFTDLQVSEVRWSRTMSQAAFVKFSLSSSITQRAIAMMGELAYRQALHALLDRYSDQAGRVEVAYVTRTTSARPRKHQGPTA